MEKRWGVQIPRLGLGTWFMGLMAVYEALGASPSGNIAVNSPPVSRAVITCGRI